jgi:leader peptidase (prepilin peptidase)/N-methyltransferase
MLGVTTGAGAALAGAFGLLLGSFLNVVAYRLPRGESLAVPASRCPGCDTPIKPYDNVPVLSWLLLRGRCRSCGATIAWRYPLVELATALLMALAVVVIGPNEDVWLGLAFVLLLVPVTVIDIDFRIIPNKLMIAGTVAALVILALTSPDDIPEHLIAAFAAGGFLLIAAIAYPSGMGMGDVKLAFVMGLFLGRDVGVAMLVALVAGSVVGIAIMARKGAQEGRKTAIPFGPFLALGGVVGLLAGDPVVEWYLRTFA